jgi:hypothetical protein
VGRCTSARARSHQRRDSAPIGKAEASPAGYSWRLS